MYGITKHHFHHAINEKNVFTLWVLREIIPSDEEFYSSVLGSIHDLSL